MRSPRLIAVFGAALLAVSTLGACTARVSGTPEAAAPVVAARGHSGTLDSSTAPAPAPHSPATRPKANPCAGNTHEQFVHVSIAAQHAWLCSANHLAYSTAVTTGRLGRDTETPTGTYQIQGRNTDTTLTQQDGSAYNVKYWIPFNAPLFGFHDSSWQNFPYGSTRYRTDGSHGCIHMPLRAMKFLYDWARIGATVRIDA